MPHTSPDAVRETRNRAVMATVPSVRVGNARVRNWLFLFAFIVAFLIVFGGFVRLTRSGLSITEWNPISGTLPPIGEQAWLVEFDKYQQTPEFQQINFNMTL
ncbi:MAG: COX15/CtaA family protein, partial [Anaerolineales bacterium]